MSERKRPRSEPLDSREPIVELVARGALVAAGVVAGHLLGYAAAGVTAPIGHGYLTPMTRLVMPAAAGAIVVLALRSARRTGTGHRGLFLPLSIMQIGVFLALETLERVPTGTWAQTLEVPAVRWGLLAQILVALVMVAVLRVTSEAIQWMLGRENLLPKPESTPRPLRASRVGPSPAWAASRARAPPRSAGD